MLASAFLLPSLVCGTAFLINFVAIYYHASRAIPFGTMVAVACICLFVILPLTLVGTVLGRNLSGSPGETTRFEPGVGARPIANSVLADFFSQLQCMPARAQADPSLILFHTFFILQFEPELSPAPSLIYFLAHYRLPLPHQRRPPPYPREEVVHGAAGDRPPGRRPAIRIHLHRDVLHLHLVLGLQDLLRLRLHAAGETRLFSRILNLNLLNLNLKTGVCDPGHRDRVRDHRLHLLPAQRRGLQMVSICFFFKKNNFFRYFVGNPFVCLFLQAVDELPVRRLHRALRLSLLLLLLLLQDQVSCMTNSRSHKRFFYVKHFPFFLRRMYGLFQTAFYFGYMALFALCLGLMCGTFGYVGTSYFVR